MAGSLLKQMLWQCPLSADCVNELRYVTEFYEKDKDEAFTSSTSVDYFAAHLVCLSGLFEDVFLIVDGLDECQGQTEITCLRSRLEPA